LMGVDAAANAGDWGRFGGQVACVEEILRSCARSSTQPSVA
jgi:hypothetical protein